MIRSIRDQYEADKQPIIYLLAPFDLSYYQSSI